jgi:UDP-glucose 4-epimerase
MSGEEYLRLYHRLHGVETVSLRLANVYGPRQDPHGEAGVVAIFCGLLLDGRPPRVFGDGNQTRDYVYVGDVVEAFLAAERGPAGATVNVGTGEEVSVHDLLDALGYEGEPEFLEARLGELQRSALDPSLAERLWGWRPRMPLAEGLRITRESVAASAGFPPAPPLAAAAG